MSGRKRPDTPLRTMRIRRARNDDTAAIREVVDSAYAQYVERMGKPPAPMLADYESLVTAGDVWIGDDEELVIGVLVMRPSGEALELENVAVSPSHQGHGYGRALIDFAERRARELGLPAVTLYTNEAMVENLRLYARLGFVETERRVEDGYRRVFFRKALDARELPR